MLAVLRRPVEIGVFLLILVLLVQAFVAEPFEVPTGSMAPALLGRHRAAFCPACGFPVRVGRSNIEHEDERRRHDARAACPNCGHDQLGIAGARETSGDRLLVNKVVYALRRPRRWEVVVFHFLGLFRVKRIVGLPGEEVAIRDGDIYIDGALARKTLAELKAMRILVFDNSYQPQPDGWRQRWEVAPGHQGPHPLVGAELHLNPGPDGQAAEVSYHHFLCDKQQSKELCDEYGYNGGLPLPLVAVHDFMFECQFEATQGVGLARFSVTDSQDRVVAELPVVDKASEGNRQTTARLLAGGQELAASPMSLETGRRYNVEMALVDRRVIVALDGVVTMTADLPSADKRAPVTKPVTLGTEGVRAIVRNFRLYRDVHYSELGSNAVGGQSVRLGPAEYFVLGDNSPDSEDSRHWSERGAVPAGRLIGQALRIPGLR